MSDEESYDYKLNSGQNQENLSMKEINNNIFFTLKKQDGTNYYSKISLSDLKDVSNAFLATQTLKEALVVLNEAIEAGNIYLTENKDVINLKIVIGNYPAFQINLILDESIAEMENKYGNSTQNTTEYTNPIVQANVKNPVQLEYVEPILQLHYPDGSTQSQVLPAKIRSYSGGNAPINEAQFKRIQEQMNLHMNNQVGTKYSLRTLPNENNNTVDNSDLYNNRNMNNNYDISNVYTQSKYATSSVPTRPVVLEEENMPPNIISSIALKPTILQNQNITDTTTGLSSNIEALYRTETGLVIFRNGILKGIIKKYSEIDKVVTKIQNLIVKGAKFSLLYRASTDGDKCHRDPLHGESGNFGPGKS